MVSNSTRSTAKENQILHIWAHFIHITERNVQKVSYSHKESECGIAGRILILLWELEHVSSDMGDQPLISEIVTSVQLSFFSGVTGANV